MLLCKGGVLFVSSGLPMWPTIASYGNPGIAGMYSRAQLESLATTGGRMARKEGEHLGSRSPVSSKPGARIRSASYVIWT